MTTSSGSSSLLGHLPRIVAATITVASVGAPWSALAAGAGGGGAGDAAAPAAPASGSSINLVNETASETGVFNFDYGVPTSPALVLAGQSPDKITTSTALKPLVIQLPTAAGSFGQTVGVDVAPGWLLPASSQTYDAYMRVGADGLPGESISDWAYRVAFRTHVGLAVAAGVANADPTKQQSSIISIGLSTSLLEHSDPLLAVLPGQKKTAWLSCLQGAAKDLDTVVNGIDSPDSKRQAIVVSLAQFHAQIEAAKAQAAALQDKSQQLDQDRAQASASRDRFNALLNGPQGRDPALVELVRDKVSTLETQIQQAQSDLDQIAKQEAALTAELAALVQSQTAAQAQFDATTVSDTTAANQMFQKSAAAKLIPACVVEANEAATFAPNLDVGAGALWDGVPGRYTGFKQSGWVLWTSYRQPLFAPAITADKPKPDSYWMVGASGRASWDEVMPTNIKATPMVAANTLDVWAGLERVSLDNRFTVQVGYQWRDPTIPLPAFDRSRFRYYFGLSQRVGPESAGAWLQLGYGDVSHTSNDRTVLVSVSVSPPSASSILGVK